MAYLRILCQRVRLSIFLCLCLARFFLRHFFTEPTVDVPLFLQPLEMIPTLL